MAARKTVLIVDDNAINRSVLHKLLSHEYNVIEACDGQQALDTLTVRGKAIACVVLDLVMPVMDGYTFLSHVEKNDAIRDIPVIVTTGSTDQDSEIRALELGAWDFVSKPYNAAILRFRMKNAIDRSLLSTFEQMRYLAEHDQLTGLYNRVKFFQVCREMLDNNPGRTFAYVRFDLDHFKLVNSFFGVSQGDDLLRRIGRFLHAYAAGHELVACGHINADVFCICLPYTTRDAMAALIERYRRKLRGYRSDFELVPCFGVYIIEDPTLPLSAMNDNAILAARTCKGNYMRSYAFYEPDMSRGMTEEQFIINNMNAALAEHQFCLYFQPKYDVRTNRPAGAEALVRWIRPERGMISPGAFIPVFERNGFISKLDYYVWDQACAVLADWKKRGRELYPISVNVSRVNLFNPNLPSLLLELTRKHDIPPALLNLEITESAYTENNPIVRQSVDALRSSGFVIMMDDFGSGYSSLNILKDIYMDYLKIDMKFVPTHRDGRAEKILASVIRMAKWLDMRVIVEGVETEEQADLMTNLGCDYIQGFYFARPMPLGDYEHLLDAQLPEHIAATAANQQFSDTLSRIAPEVAVLLKNVNQPVVVLRIADGRPELLQVNEAFRKIIGYDESRSPLENACLTDAGRRDLNTGIHSAADQHGTAEVEYMRLDPDGRVRWLHVHLQYLTMLEDSPLLFGVFSDVSERHLLETRLARARRELTNMAAGERYLLIVDDQEINRALLMETFGTRYLYLEASDGQQALMLMREHSREIAAVLLDMMMPGLSGLDVLDVKNSDPAIASIPVVAISADDQADMQLGALNAGVSDYVTKPFVPELVLKRVLNVIESSRKSRIFTP